MQGLYIESLTTIDTTPYKPGQLGAVHIGGTKVYQYVKFATTVAAANYMLYWSDPDNYVVTATIANLINEPAGRFLAAVTAANSYGWIQVAGEGAILGNGTFAAGMQVLADSGGNRVVPEYGIVEGALAAVDTAGGVFAWASPYSHSVLCSLAGMNVGTASSGACTIDVGYTAVSAVTSSATLIDGVSVAATGFKSSVTDNGTDGRGAQVVAAGKWITASVASGASSGLVGSYYLRIEGIVGLNPNSSLTTVGVAQGAASGGAVTVNMTLGPKPRNQ